MSLGMIGKKAGMTRIFDSSGISIPVTAISVSPNQITQIKTIDKDGYKVFNYLMDRKKNLVLIKRFLVIIKNLQSVQEMVLLNLD